MTVLLLQIGYTSFLLRMSFNPPAWFNGAPPGRPAHFAPLPRAAAAVGLTPPRPPPRAAAVAPAEGSSFGAGWLTSSWGSWGSALSVALVALALAVHAAALAAALAKALACAALCYWAGLALGVSPPLVVRGRGGRLPSGGEGVGGRAGGPRPALSPPRSAPRLQAGMLVVQGFAFAPVFLALATVAACAGGAHWLHHAGLPAALPLLQLALLCAAVPLGCSPPAFVVRTRPGGREGR